MAAGAVHAEFHMVCMVFDDMDGLMDGSMDGWTDGCMDGWKMTVSRFRIDFHKLPRFWSLEPSKLASSSFGELLEGRVSTGDLQDPPPRFEHKA